MEPWYKVVTPRKEVREGRSFDPSEFAIHLEQVVAGTAPDDYKKPEHFLTRTSFTRALREHAGLVLRRLSGETTNTAPVMTLVTQFGGGKTHTLTLLYHLARHGEKLAGHPDVSALLREAGLKTIPTAKPGVFVGNAWDPQDGRETPWIDLARQLAGDAGVALLGKEPKETPPGTEAIGRIIQAAGGKVLFLFDEVLNCLNRHRKIAEPFHAFLQNLSVAVTAAPNAAAVVSLPRSQVEMTDWDQEWQDRINKVIRRVARDLIANDEAEIGEVVRRRLFEDLGKETVRRIAAKTYADWCFDKRQQLPPEWTAVDSAATEAKARDFLRARFETCYPIHPATLTVFQRKWQSLPQFQQTRGTLAMLAQWVALAYKTGYERALRREALLTLGSAPLDDRGFRSTVLGQLGEPRLGAAIDSDIAGAHSHSAALDADTPPHLKDLHKRVGATILFESSGGQSDKAAHLPDLRFALGEPGIDLTSIDNAAVTLARKGYYIRQIGTDGYRFGYTPTLNKVVSDRRASLDDEEIRKACETLVRKEFERGAGLPLVIFPADGAAVPHTTRLTVVVIHPDLEWGTGGELRRGVAEWTRAKGASPRLYPAALLWAVRKPGRELRDRVETWLAWKRVEKELHDGTLGGDFDRAERAQIGACVRDAEETAQDEVWAAYRFVVLADRDQADGLHVIDLGAGHASHTESLTGRIVSALRMESMLNDAIGASYLDRKWPHALKESGAWPLSGLRQAFLTGALGRLLDVEAVLKEKLPGFVERGEFGLASGARPGGRYARVWFSEPVDRDEITFDADVYLLTKAAALALRSGTEAVAPAALRPGDASTIDTVAAGGTAATGAPAVVAPPARSVLRVSGEVPAESWNRLGTRLIPKLRSGRSLTLRVEAVVEVDGGTARAVEAEIRQALEDLRLTESLKIE